MYKNIKTTPIKELTLKDALYLLSVVEHFASEDLEFVNVLEDNQGDHKLFKQVENMALQCDSLVVPVTLLISAEENNKRIQRPDRVLRCIEGNAELINIMHPHLLEIDVSDLTASALAEKIVEHTNNIE
nr:hypothetical protein [Rickettsia massiliae]